MKEGRQVMRTSIATVRVVVTDDSMPSASRPPSSPQLSDFDNRYTVLLLLCTYIHITGYCKNG
jgi:hypothetical protein